MEKHVIDLIKVKGLFRPFGIGLSRITFTVALVILLINVTVAQVNIADTVDIIERIVAKEDTMVRNKVVSGRMQRLSSVMDRPIDSVLFQNRRSRFTKELYNLLIRDDAERNVHRMVPTTNTGLAALDGAIIRHIRFTSVDVFAPSVTDTNYVAGSWFERSVNATHNNTRVQVLKRYLLFEPGDKLDVFLLAENEKLLRDLSFIMDVRFMAQRVHGSPDSVDVLLITQDMLPIGIHAEMVKTTIAELGASHHNILGYGHRFMATSYWDAENRPHFGYQISYDIPNLAGSFTKGELDYIHKWNQESIIFDFSRDFKSASFRNAGGFRFENSYIHKDIVLLDTTLYDVDVKYANADFWAGRMFPLKQRWLKMRSGIYLTGRLNQYENYDGPRTDDDFLYSLQDKTLMLFSLGYTRQGFHKDNLIYTFGRTEDVPYGFLIDMTSGVEWGQYKTRPYFSVGTSFSTFFKNMGNIACEVKLGSFLYQGLMEQGAFRIHLRYISPLIGRGRFHYRNFITVNYLQGINRYDGEFTSMGNNYGIYGLTSSRLYGKDKVVINLESVMFSPYRLLGFRFAFFGNVDIGWINHQNNLSNHYRMFSGIGAGVRIRNDQLVFDTFVIRLAWYPGKPGDADPQYFVIDSMPRTRFDDFFPAKPTLVSYE